MLRFSHIGGGGKSLISLLFTLLTCSLSHGQEVEDSVKIFFRQGYSVLDLSIGDNRNSIKRIADSLQLGYSDSIYVLTRIHVTGGASPEGTIPLNKRLSEKRAKVIFEYLSKFGELPDSLTTFNFIGRDWWGLIELVEADMNVPYREETLEYLRDIADRSQGGEKLEDNNVGRLSRFKGGEPYRYMYRNLFPELRASSVHLYYKKMRNPIALPLFSGIAAARPSAPSGAIKNRAPAPVIYKKPEEGCPSGNGSERRPMKNPLPDTT